MTTLQTQKCRECKAEKGLEEFAYRKKAMEVRHTQCKACKKSYNDVLLGVSPVPPPPLPEVPMTTKTIPTEKHCKRCGKDHPASAFDTRPQAADGLNHWCKDCMARHNGQPVVRPPDPVAPPKPAFNPAAAGIDEDEDDDDETRRMKANIWLTEQVIESRAIVAELNVKLSQALSGGVETRRLEAALKEAEGRIETAKATFGKLEKEVKLLEGARLEADERYRKAQAEAATLQADNKVLATKAVDLGKEVNELARTVNSLTDDRKRLTDEIALRDMEIEELKERANSVVKSAKKAELAKREKEALSLLGYPGAKA